MELPEIVIKRIEEEGPISFHDFMEMALYYPKKGYYTSAQNKIGKSGDFYTSSNLTPAFGWAIARQLEEMWDLLGRSPFTVVEYGAGTGLLCGDIMDYLKNNKELYDQLNYCIIEKSPALWVKEKAHLHEKVSWHDSIEELTEIRGCILSNELLDNFSVHQVVIQEEVMEVYVDYQNGFVELLQPASKALTDYLAELNVVLPKGFRIEINLEAIKWIEKVAASLYKGFVITIDYGYPSDRLYSNSRREGTVICYHKHTVCNNVYAAIGEQDITSHVNFSALCHWGFKNGLLCCGLTSQAGFLLALGFKDLLRSALAFESMQDIVRRVQKEAFLCHTLLVDMGLKFKVLIQRKGIEKKDLLGLKFT